MTRTADRTPDELSSSDAKPHGSESSDTAQLRLQTAALSASAESSSLQLELSVNEEEAILTNTEEQAKEIETLIATLEDLRQASRRRIEESSLLGDILRLESELEEEEARRLELERARDLAWQTYRALARKADEVNVAAETVGSEVKFAMPAIKPSSPVAPRKVMNTALGLMLGLVIGVLGAFGLEYFEVNGE